jgi:hypothetical protein
MGMADYRAGVWRVIFVGANFRYFRGWLQISTHKN